MGFHAHIYFTPETRSSAEKLQLLIGEKFRPQLRHWGRLIDRPIGPHPTPMFEIDFEHPAFSEIVTFLMLNHGVHSVLIHPETGNDLKDHTAHAIWLGETLPLDLNSFL